jgi:hypothetical protein
LRLAHHAGGRPPTPLCDANINGWLARTDNFDPNVLRSAERASGRTRLWPQATHEVGDEPGHELVGDWFVGNEQPVIAGTPKLVDQDAGVDVGSKLPTPLGPLHDLDGQLAAGCRVVLAVGGG